MAMGHTRGACGIDRPMDRVRAPPRRGKDDGLRNWHLAGKGQERVSANELDPGMFCWGGIRAKETVQETITPKKG